MMKNTVQRLLVAVLLIITAYGCDKKLKAEIETDFTKVTNVEVYTVTTSSFDDFITLPVVVSPYKEANLGLTSGGRVTKIHVDKGDRVTKDMVLLETDDVLLKAQFKQAEANLVYQKKEFARNKKLFEDGTISPADFDGSEVQAGIPEKHIVSFKLGNTVTVSLDAIPDKVFKGKINYISHEASPSVRTFLAEMVVDNSKGTIKAGIMGNARILRTVYEDAILIPINAIVEAQEGRSVFVARDDNTAEERTIVLGEGSDDLMVIITAGVHPGDRVIVKGQQDLVTGERILVTGEYAAESVEGSEQ